jgi:Uncharacterized conserved protein
MTVVITEGTAERHLRAERATLTFTPRVVADTAAAAVAGVESTVTTLAARARALRDSGDATWHQVGTVRVHSRTVGQDDDRVEHIAQASVQIKLANLDLVGPLTSEFSAATVSVTPQWALTEQTRHAHEREVRIAAVAAARARAEDYAAALQGTVREVLEVSDLAGPTASGVRGASASPAAAEVTVPEITVSGRVTARFDVR